MPSSYKINLSSLNQEGLQEIIEILEAVFQKYDVDFYVIGALAGKRYLVFERKNSNPGYQM